MKAVAMNFDASKYFLVNYVEPFIQQDVDSKKGFDFF